ncbi:MAG: STAS domain-containing protein [Planctomycetes bacterium]|nr:STAS domain-containing protein [Planctomycetota bacterium]
MPEAYQAKPLDAGRYELTLAGRVYADATPQLKDHLMALADQGLRGLLVDASDLEQIDSSGLNVFVSLLKRIRPDGGKIAFYGLNPNIQRVFEITKLATVMSVEVERSAALGSLA